MCKIYLAGMNGAPSKTAVIISKVELENIDWKKLSIETYNFLQEKQIEFSKLAIIYEKNKNVFDYKFIQIKNQNGQIELETNANCGNSMLAAARIVDNIKNICCCLYDQINNLKYSTFLKHKTKTSMSIEIIVL